MLTLSAGVRIQRSVLETVFVRKTVRSLPSKHEDCQYYAKSNGIYISCHSGTDVGRLVVSMYNMFARFVVRVWESTCLMIINSTCNINSTCTWVFTTSADLLDGVSCWRLFELLSMCTHYLAVFINKQASLHSQSTNITLGCEFNNTKVSVKLTQFWITRTVSPYKRHTAGCQCSTRYPKHFTMLQGGRTCQQFSVGI